MYWLLFSTKFPFQTTNINYNFRNKISCYNHRYAIKYACLYKKTRK